MTDIIVYGRGKTGIGLHKMAKKLGMNAIFYDDDNGFENGESFNKNSVVVVSPGVEVSANGIKMAKEVGANILSELDFCFPYCKGKCVSVTGTNGKTTVCQMIHFILQKSNVPTRLLGNGGIPFSTEVLDVTEKEIVVLESSSFQLHNTKIFEPYISVFTNLAQDHLNFHGSFDNYKKAKCNNFCHQKTTDFAIFNAGDKQVLQISLDSVARTFYYSVNNKNANCYYDNGVVCLNVFGKKESYECSYFKKLAKHNISNAMAAILTCYLAGVSVQQCCDALQEYQILPHRLQTVDFFNGVTFVDDSKATNAHATISALSCYENIPLTVIMGGSDKDCSFDEIFEQMRSNVKLVCAVGQTAEKIAISAKKYNINVLVCNYKQAVERCYKKLKNIGGIVLMSNACASFDMFENYAQRGDYFTKLVEELRREQKV